MGIATDHAPARNTSKDQYSRWEIDILLTDSEMKEIDRFTCKQQVMTASDQFAVRLQRLDVDGRDGQYEDRGPLQNHAVIKGGKSGFGGQLEGRLLPNGGVFLQGSGGAVDFIMTATPTGPDHFRCFRRFEVHTATNVWGTRLEPGTYFITTEDQMVESKPEAPAEMLKPLAKDGVPA